MSYQPGQLVEYETWGGHWLPCRIIVYLGDDVWKIQRVGSNVFMACHEGNLWPRSASSALHALAEVAE